MRLVREVHALGALGIKAEQTRPFLDCLVSGNAEGDDCPASLETYRSAIADMSSRIADLTQRRDALIALLASASDRAEPLCDLTPTTHPDLQETWPMSMLASRVDRLATFAQEVLASETPVLVEYWAEWCGPCRQVSPVLEELAVEYGDRLRIVKMNSDENVVTAAAQRVMAVPTLQVFQRGELVRVDRRRQAQTGPGRRARPVCRVVRTASRAMDGAWENCSHASLVDRR